MDWKRWTVLAAICLAGCASTQKTRLSEPEGPYRIGREDVVEVAVFQAPELSRTVPVRPDGKISLPLLGDVEVAGKSAQELADELRSKLEAVVQSPRVTVIIREINAARIYVIGEVVHPGAYPVRGNLDAIQALALAGGFGDFASRGRVLLIRKGPKGDERMVVDYDELVKNADSVIPRMMPGDTLYVP
ncbi:polysaccharide biosynthesis/export family protein [Vulgatibacter incomptus]|uniref:Capsule polysaccharide export protein n=1 Tax=Vulgatibacter incomptus TaxID=1391653 RepID=A0A0K1PAT3_9BACT|nr:polysaccharide biosynthesis/export family protein [Vulgatibacter incomptus]AKU90653.1 Capsule polysaccharide export protein [Vulgatibacter incomptus]